MDDHHIYGLIDVAEAQQKTVQSSLDALAAQLEVMQRVVAGLNRATTGVHQAAVDAVPALRQMVGLMVAEAVKRSMAGAAEVAAQSLKAATGPVVRDLDRVVQAAIHAEGSMRTAGAWFAWKWVVVAAGGLFGVCFLAYASLAWQMQAVASLRTDKNALTMDVANLTQTVAALEKKGGRITYSTCGGRLCIRASTHQDTGYGSVGDPYVIPRGY